jgi:hypothetical protein
MARLHQPNKHLVESQQLTVVLWGWSVLSPKSLEIKVDTSGLQRSLLNDCRTGKRRRLAWFPKWPDIEVAITY